MYINLINVPNDVDIFTKLFIQTTEVSSSSEYFYFIMLANFEKTSLIELLLATADVSKNS